MSAGEMSPDPSTLVARIEAAVATLAEVRRRLGTAGEADLPALSRALGEVAATLPGIATAESPELRRSVLTLLDELGDLIATLSSERERSGKTLAQLGQHQRAGAAYRDRLLARG